MGENNKWSSYSVKEIFEEQSSQAEAWKISWNLPGKEKKKDLQQKKLHLGGDSVKEGTWHIQ